MESVLSLMKYSALIRRNVIPDLLPLIPKTQKKRPYTTAKYLYSADSLYLVVVELGNATWRENVALQLVSLWALTNYNIVGLVHDGAIIARFDFSASSRFGFTFEYEEIRKSLERPKVPTGVLMDEYPIGKHVSNAVSWQDAFPDRPCQIYLTFLREYCRGPTYIHVPMDFNTVTSRNAIADLTAQIQGGIRYGVRGIVIHVGKAKAGVNVPAAYKRMYDVMLACMILATPQCKLLLENCAGSKSEMCAGFDLMNDFLALFPVKYRDRLGICIDTCHTYVSGALPNEYLAEWIRRGVVPCELVHFNDSKPAFGTCYDRHAEPGMGYIGYEMLREVANLCVANGIAMVGEW
jgi:hypothetical protein